MTEIAGTDTKRFDAEEHFHDEWAESTAIGEIDVMLMNESVTAPEMRFITQKLGDLSERSLLDVGCGLGEASVYFAIQGAKVTATDISGGMLAATDKLAQRYNVKVQTHKSTAENLDFPSATKFDVVYVGNLFHHTEIDSTIHRLKEVMHPDSVMMSWDPVHYNPIINVYRRLASNVRTDDEHPFKRSDVQLFKKHFVEVNVRFFWLTTLIIFILMALVQFRNPNKERYWKKVVEEGGRWRWLYLPLEKLDRLLLTLFPFLGWLCWNIVIEAKQPRT